LCEAKEKHNFVNITEELESLARLDRDTDEFRRSLQEIKALMEQKAKIAATNAER